MNESGVFNREASFESEPAQTVPAVEPAATAESHPEESQVEPQAPAVKGKKKQPEITAAPEAPATQPEKPVDIPQAKLYANKYETTGKMANGILDIAKVLGKDGAAILAEVNSPEEMEEVYMSLRRELSEGGGVTLPTAEKPAQQPEQPEQPDNIPEPGYDSPAAILTQTAQMIQEAETILAEPLFFESMDEIELGERLAENPKAVLSEMYSALEKRFEAKINFEGARLLRTLYPVLEDTSSRRVDTMMGRAFDSVSSLIAEHGDNDFTALQPKIAKHVETHPELLEMVQNAPPQSKQKALEAVLRIAYKEVKAGKLLIDAEKAAAGEEVAETIESKKGLASIPSGSSAGSKLNPGPSSDLEQAFGKTNESRGVFG